MQALQWHVLNPGQAIALVGTWFGNGNDCLGHVSACRGPQTWQRGGSVRGTESAHAATLPRMPLLDQKHVGVSHSWKMPNSGFSSRRLHVRFGSLANLWHRASATLQPPFLTRLLGRLARPFASGSNPTRRNFDLHHLWHCCILPKPAVRPGALRVSRSPAIGPNREMSRWQRVAPMTGCRTARTAMSAHCARHGGCPRPVN